VSKTISGNASRFSRRILASGLAALAAGMTIASPAYADYSEGYKFLESVKKKEGDKVEKQLMDNSQIVNAKDVTTGETALMIVTQRRDATWLNFLIGKGANVNLADDHGRTPLQMAVSLGWRDGLLILLDAKASTDVSNDAGETPLIFAVHRKDVEMVKALLQAGANADRADNSGRSARDYANTEGGKGSQLAQTVETYGVKGGKAKAVYGPVM